MPRSSKKKRDSLQRRNARRIVGDGTRKIRAAMAGMQQIRRSSAIIAALAREMDKVEKGKLTAEAFEEIHGLVYFEAVQCWYQHHLSKLQMALRSQVPLISEAECEAILKGEPLP